MRDVIEVYPIINIYIMFISILILCYTSLKFVTMVYFTALACFQSCSPKKPVFFFSPSKPSSLYHIMWNTYRKEMPLFVDQKNFVFLFGLFLVVECNFFSTPSSHTGPTTHISLSTLFFSTCLKGSRPMEVT